MAPPALSSIKALIANPAYGGAYAYGKTGVSVQYDGAGAKTHARRKPRAEWLALQPGAHEGYIAWERSEAIRKMVSDNVPTANSHGAPKHGAALLSGLLRCRRCGRKLTVQGGDHWAVIASLIETCKLNRVNPQAWLSTALTSLADGHPASALGRLMPWTSAPDVA